MLFVFSKFIFIPYTITLLEITGFVNNIISYSSVFCDNIYFYHFCIIYHTFYLVNLYRENELSHHKAVHFFKPLVNLFTRTIAVPFHFSTNLRTLCAITL